MEPCTSSSLTCGMRCAGRGAAPPIVSPARRLLLYPQASSYTAGSRTISWDNPCDYFTVGKAKASTLSLSVLVAIEML